ncbi:MAG: SDR family oxidoreductase [Acholeplasmataceae bacterium]|nr:SDR family oxidoreductase [Acholeplasmataceae bacterium]
MKVKDKVIAVTGGGNGIGRELVLQLLAKGARVAAVDLSEKALNETLKLSGESKSKLSVHLLDITDRLAVEALPEDIIKIHGHVDGILNNAGIIQPFIPVNDLDYNQIQKVMDVNFYGVLYMVKTFLPILKKRPIAHIVNISSMGGFLPVPGQSVYGASKAAVKLLTEGLHGELKDTNIKVTVVFPGGVGTNIMKNSGVNMDEKKMNEKKASYKMLTPAKAAALIIQGMEKNRYRLCVGSDSRFMDFFYRLSPKRAAGLIAKKLENI